MLHIQPYVTTSHGIIVNLSRTSQRYLKFYFQYSNKLYSLKLNIRIQYSFGEEMKNESIFFFFSERI